MQAARTTVVETKDNSSMQLNSISGHHHLAALVFLLLTVALGTASCDRKTVYTEYEHVTGNNWEKADTTVRIPISMYFVI